MRFDVREPGKTLGDRFVLGAGHCTPMLYSALALMNEVMRAAHDRSGEARFALPSDEHRVLRLHDLLRFRRGGGLPGHAEMEGKTLFVKWNTGPSGHGLPSAAGEALALLHAGRKDVCVFAMDGEGGLSAGGVHEVKNAAHGLGLENYVVLLDWNDFGIDHPQHSSFVHGNPQSWFEPYGFRVAGTEHGEDFAAVIRAYRQVLADPAKGGRPGAVWTRNRKGRGYGVEGYKSHGTAHKPNSEIFWSTKTAFQEKYGVKFEGFGEAPPKDAASFTAQTRANLDIVIDVLRRDTALVDFLASRLVAAADAVPSADSALRFDRRVDPSRDERITDVTKYPAELFLKPGTVAPNRQGFSAFGAYVNAIANDVAKRPLFLVCAADLAESTNIAGFAKEHGGFKGFGWYERNESPQGCLIPQQITEFSNSAMMVGLASVNFAPDPEKEFVG
jgi:transketolase